MTLAQLTQQCINLLRSGTPGDTPVTTYHLDSHDNLCEQVVCSLEQKEDRIALDSSGALGYWCNDRKI